MAVAAIKTEIGHEYPVFERESGFAAWNRYAAVNDEFVDIHMDDEVGRAAGYPSAFGMGNLTWAYFHVAIHWWLGDGVRIARLAVQFRGAVTRGELLRVGGLVTAVQGNVVDLEVWADTGRGVRLAPGSATVELPVLQAL